MRHWYKPGFWVWWWRNQAGHDTRGAALVLLLLAIGVGGYLAASQLTEPEQVFTEQVITVTRTTIVKGKPRVVTELRTVRVKTPPKVKTVVRDGQTVLVTTPGETVVSTQTVAGPVRQVVKRQTVTKTVAGRTTVRRVTLPGVTLPGTTIQGPERVITTTLPNVTLPGETVERETVRTIAGPTVTNTVTGPTQTVTGPTQTQTQTVTGPTQTVTGPTQTVTGPTQTVTGPTQTVTGPTVTVTGPTRTVTETETVTVTQPPGGNP